VENTRYREMLHVANPEDPIYSAVMHNPESNEFCVG